MQRSNPIPTLNHLFFHHLDTFQHTRLLSWRRPHETVVYSTESFAASVFALRNFLCSTGLADGDRVALFSENRPEWHIADFAILLARQTVVPVYATLAPSQVEHVLGNSGCRALVISGQEQWAIIQPMLRALPHIEWVIWMDECASAEPRDSYQVTSLKRIVAAAPLPDQQAKEEIRAAALSVDPQTVATIVYTSGTTALPKGVMLTHANLVFDLERSIDRLGFRTVAQALSVLPLAHVFERLLCYGYFRMGVPIAYGDPYDLRELLKLHRPQVMGCVPRILEKIRDAVATQLELLPRWKRGIAQGLFRAALEQTIAASEGRKAGWRGWLGRVARPVLGLRVRGQLGGLRYFICGGAWLDPVLEQFFRSIGFVVLQGYGMTETSPVITLNLMGQEKPGSVGPALDGVELRIGEDGEIMTRGPHVMLGYYNDADATGRTFRDGWLLTGDLGSIDERGCLRITGRRKELLVLSNGKKVVCAPLEQAIERSDIVQNAFVVGEGRKFAGALIVPHLRNLARLAQEGGIPFENSADLLHAAPAWSLVRQEIDTQQAAFSNFERVKRFCFLPEEALLDPELVTPTQKVRREVMHRKYAAWIAQMYEQEEPPVISRFGSVTVAQSAVV